MWLWHVGYTAAPLVCFQSMLVASCRRRPREERLDPVLPPPRTLPFRRAGGRRLLALSTALRLATCSAPRTLNTR